MKRSVLLFVAMLMASCAGAFGQEPDPAQPSDPCQAQPDRQTQEGEPSPPAETSPSERQQPQETDKLSDTLGRCGSVLKPPPTGDADIAEPPPDVGRTPIIRPDETPPQQP